MRCVLIVVQGCLFVVHMDLCFSSAVLASDLIPVYFTFFLSGMA